MLRQGMYALSLLAVKHMDKRTQKDRHASIVMHHTSKFCMPELLPYVHHSHENKTLCQQKSIVRKRAMELGGGSCARRFLGIWGGGGLLRDIRNDTPVAFPSANVAPPRGDDSASCSNSIKPKCTNLASGQCQHF